MNFNSITKLQYNPLFNPLPHKIDEIMVICIFRFLHFFENDLS